MPEMKTLQGYEIVDAKARKDIEALKNAGHATEEYVDNAIAAIPEVDLTPYATETYVDNAIDNIPEVDLSKHALKSELPTKVSQLENDSKFITREEVPETDLSEYAKKSELPTVPKKVSELTNDAGYITAAEVPKTDLSAYAKKSEIPDVSDFITSIPSEYITESELDAKLDPIEASIAAIEADCPETYFLDFSDATDGYKAATEHMNKFANKFMFGANKEAMVMMRTPSSQYYYPAIVSIYAGTNLILTPIAINPNTIDTTPLSWEGIYLWLDNPTKNTWSYRKYGSITKTLVSKEYVDNEIANIDIPEDTDLTGYATEEYVNTTVNDAISAMPCVTEVINVTALTETSQTLNELYFPGVTDILNRIANGEKFPFCLQTYNDVYVYPERLTPGLDYIVIKAGSEITNRTSGIYASYSLYKFERRNDIWYGYTEKPSTLIRSTNTEA